GPHKHHGHHHHRRTFRPRPTIPQSITTPAEPEQSTQLPAITTSAAEVVVTDVVSGGPTSVPVVTDVVTGEVTFIPDVLSTEGSMVTRADFEPSTNVPDIASSTVEVVVTNVVTAEVTSKPTAVTSETATVSA
ncbi:unnamed protein product, partial [Strongylus vulgaris]